MQMDSAGLDLQPQGPELDTSLGFVPSDSPVSLIMLWIALLLGFHEKDH